MQFTALAKGHLPCWHTTLGEAVETTVKSKLVQNKLFHLQTHGLHMVKWISKYIVV